MTFGENWHLTCQGYCHTCVGDSEEWVLFLSRDIESSFYCQLMAEQEHTCLCGYPGDHAQESWDQVSMLRMYRVAVSGTAQTPNLPYFSWWWGLWLATSFHQMRTYQGSPIEMVCARERAHVYAHHAHVLIRHQ